MTSDYEILDGEMMELTERIAELEIYNPFRNSARNREDIQQNSASIERQTKIQDGINTRVSNRLKALETGNAATVRIIKKVVKAQSATVEGAYYIIKTLMIEINESEVVSDYMRNRVKEFLTAYEKERIDDVD